MEKVLPELEIEDVLGKPVLGLIAAEVHKEDRNKPKEEQRLFAKVVEVFEWADGEPIDPDNLIDNVDWSDEKVKVWDNEDTDKTAEWKEDNQKDESK